MILDTLTLRNFCLYRGTQVLRLTPALRDGRPAPIILVGGVNGSGKTTLLDAIGLLLYGSRAACCKRAGKPYEQFLRDSIHRSEHQAGGASIALRFRYASEGVESLYEVRRSWRTEGKRVRERLLVCRDGEPDAWLTERWNDVVEELIPRGISELFFFDAEQIRLIAEDVARNSNLGPAVKSLLGLDLAERLIADAGVLEARLLARAKITQERGELQELEHALAAKENALRQKKAERAALENDLLRAQERLREAEEVFASAGGNLWKEREANQQHLKRLEQREAELRQQLVALAGSELPLALVQDLLASIQDRDQQEREAREGAILLRVLEERDASILKDLEGRGIPKEILKRVKEVQDADRAKRNTAGVPQPPLSLSDSAHHLLLYVRSRILPNLCDQTKEAIQQLETIERQIEVVQRALQASPDEAQVQEVAQELRSATSELAVLGERADRLDQEIKGLQLERDDLESRYRKLRRRCVEQEIQAEEAARMAMLAIRTQETMREFLRRAAAAKIDRLSSLVTNSFRFLLRKQTLVQRVEICPQTFEVVLYDPSGGVLPKERLSEGEKQLLAISILWGLAQASPRPLPAIIDTPMARLDAEHRMHLVERYFPNASHQVVILSTDTEVDKRYYSLLKPFIARAYRLNYSEEKRATTVEESYFWTDYAVSQEA